MLASSPTHGSPKRAPATKFSIPNRLIAAPTSTIDFTLPAGDDIPIEERSSEEVTASGGNRIAPEEVVVMNPAFDVTPHRLIAAIITERGIARPPYNQSLGMLTTQAKT